MNRNLNRIGLKPTRQDVVRVGNHYESINPRSIGICLDRPGMSAGVNEHTICDPSLHNYIAGSPYGSTPSRGEYGMLQNFPDECCPNYEINNAQIQYYIDPSTQMPFYSPVYSEPASVRYIDYTDPMGSWKPTYVREVCAPDNPCPLSFLNDTTMWREDLMARQQSVRNQQLSTPFL